MSKFKIIGIVVLVIGVIIFNVPSTTMDTNNKIVAMNSKIEICQKTIDQYQNMIDLYSEQKEKSEREIRNDYTLSYVEKNYNLTILDSVYETKIKEYKDQVYETSKKIKEYKAEIETLKKNSGPTQYAGVVVGILGIVMIVIGFFYKPYNPNYTSKYAEKMPNGVSNSKLDLMSLSLSQCNSNNKKIWICENCGEKNTASQMVCKGCGEYK